MDSVKYRKLETIMLKVFEAFAGYGSQRMALRNVGRSREMLLNHTRLYIVIF